MAQASFMAVGDLPGGIYYSECLALSRDGGVAFGDSITGGAPPFGATNSAFRFIPSAGILELDPAYATVSTYAYAASQDGLVAAGTAQNAPTSGDITAFRWTRAGGIQILGDLPGGLTNAAARGMSADGGIIAGTGSSDASYGSCGNCTEAWVWTAAAGMVGLGDLSGGAFNSGAAAVSADGVVIVGSGTTADGPVAARWVGGQTLALGYLAGSTPLQSQGLAVSRDGSVVVGASSSANGSFEAFRWTAAGGMEGLGDLPGTPFLSYAYGISGDGSVVVGVGTIPGGLFGSGLSRAFIWDRAHGMRDLREVLTGLGLDLDGWTLLAARAISDDGTVVAGYGADPLGRTQGWIARLPAQACAANCDGSTIPPVLNVNDFICFQTRYAAGDSYANCDGSTTPPVLNVNDFICFVNQYSAGCP